MAHVYAARAVLPGMIGRGGGYFLQMASAAGLLNQIGDAAYSTTKHAAVGFAEALAITHGDEGIQVSVICPQYVATPMLGYEEGDDFRDYPGVLGPDQVADSVIKGLEDESFLIAPPTGRKIPPAQSDRLRSLDPWYAAFAQQYY